MKKSLFALGLLVLSLSSCGGGGSAPTPGPTQEEFKNVFFDNLTVDYDGQSHCLGEVRGAPEGTNITYTGRDSYIDAGIYQASALLTKENYKDKTLNATLTINKISFTGLEYAPVSVAYDGNDHFNDVTLTGTIPQDTKVTKKVTNAKGQEITSAINVGTYTFETILENKNYNYKSYRTTLTITPIDFQGFTYESVTVNYDGKDHIGDVKLIGAQPQGTTVKETITDANGKEVNSAIDVGTYNYKVVISNPNYNELTLTATLKIKAVKKDMPVFVDNSGVIYFPNGLDNSFLYKVATDSTISKIDSSSPKEFNKYSSSSAVFIAGTSLMNSVKEVKNGQTDVIYTDSNIDDFVKVTESIYAYSSNSLTSSKSGIYLVDATDKDNEPVKTKIFEGKTNNLAVYGNDLYFTNGNDHNYIYKLNLTNYSTSLVLGEKTHEFVINNNKMYCSVNGLLNDKIAYINLADAEPSLKTLTNASGEYLVIKNNKLYFNYTDLWGAIKSENYGVWSIDLNTQTETHLITTENVNGFDVDNSGNIFYINTSDLRLYKYDVLSKQTTDLLKDFEIKETVPLNIGGKTLAYGKNIYYLNMYADKTLYVYNEDSQKSYQLTTNKVQDFVINNDVLYFNQVTMLTNNDIYSLNLKVSSEIEKICSNDLRNMVVEGNYIYGTHYNWAGTAGGIARMMLDGSGYVKFSETNGAKNFSVRDGKLYFINCSTGQDNGNIEYISLSDITTEPEQKLDGTNLSKNIKNVKQFIFDNDNIFYSYDGTTTNAIRRTSFSTLTEGFNLANADTNPTEFVISGDDIYYYSYLNNPLKTKLSGFYKVNKNQTTEDKYELIIGYDKQYYATAISLSESGNLYFLNSLSNLYGDAHTYKLNLANKAVTKIA